MRKICTLICAGTICFTGFAVHAQMPGNMDMDSMIQSLTEGQSVSVDSIIGDLRRSFTGAPGQTEPLVSAIQGPLIVETAVPEVNQTVAAVLIGDTRTGRYVPRLRINFFDYPLRNWTPSKDTGNAANSEGNVRNGDKSTDALALRIQNKLRIPELSIVVEDRTAIISGTAETANQRNRVELMLRFEPGIDAVRNEIEVVP